MKTIYCNTVALYNKTHTYHINSIDECYNLHSETGSQWEELVDAIDTIGEQMKVLGSSVPSISECLAVSIIKDVTTDKIAEELYKDNETLKALLESTSKQNLDEGTKNIIADRILVHGKACLKLKSLIEREHEEKEAPKQRISPMFR